MTNNLVLYDSGFSAFENGMKLQDLPVGKENEYFRKGWYAAQRFWHSR